MSFLSKGSSRRYIQSYLFEIVGRLSEMNSEIIPIHLSRTDERIMQEDDLSKTCDSDDWSIDEISFRRLAYNFGLQIDAFADNVNARLKRFYSRLFVEGTEGVETFSQRWSDGMWMCPPVKLLPAIARELRRRNNCSVLLIVPDWPTKSFYSLFFFIKMRM
jgi:hypothetical protein